MDLIKVQNLHKSFGDLKVLNDINLNIKKGSIFGLVGHSGAGKSTLLRTFNGLESINQGSIVIDGLEVSTLNPKDLRHLRQKIGTIEIVIFGFKYSIKIMKNKYIEKHKMR